MLLEILFKIFEITKILKSETNLYHNKILVKSHKIPFYAIKNGAAWVIINVTGSISEDS